MVHTALVFGHTFPADPRFLRLGIGCSALAVAAVFCLDWLIPPGVGVPVLYVVILWASLWWATPAQAIVIAAVTSLLTVAGFAFSYPVELSPDGINRAAICSAGRFPRTIFPRCCKQPRSCQNSADSCILDFRASQWSKP